ncbi:MAG: alpha/beta fold hydrolase [Gemmatimonadota bacterium]
MLELSLVLALPPVANATQWPTQSAPIPRIFQIAVAEGESLHVTIQGEGAPVVLLPGLLGSAYSYRRVTSALIESGFQTVVIEPLGLGNASRPSRADYSLTAQSDRVATAMGRLGIRQAIVVAHAVGASIALRLAYRHPDLVRGIVSLDGGPAEAAATPGFRRAMRFAPWVKMLGGIRLVRRELRKEMIAGSADTSWVTDEVIAGYTSGQATDLDGTLRAYLQMAGAREPERLAPNLHRIACPVRLLVGTAPHNGGIGRAEVLRLRAELPDFSIEEIAGAGHFLQEERPDVVSLAVQLVAHRAVAARP